MSLLAGIITAIILALLGTFLSLRAGIHAFQAARRLADWSLRRRRMAAGWRFFILAIYLIILVVLLPLFGEAAAYRYFPALRISSSSPTETIVPTGTPTQTLASTSAGTDMGTLLPTITLTQTPTGTPTPAQTRWPTPTPTRTPLPSVTNTPTRIQTATSIFTATLTRTPTLTPTPTQTRWPTPTPNGTPGPLKPPTVTLTPTRTLASTPTGKQTKTSILTATLTRTPTLTPTPSQTRWPTPTQTGTPGPLKSPTMTLTPTVTLTPTPVVITAYDFVANVCSAHWVSGTGELPCPGTDGDSRGFVLIVDNPQLEGGTISEQPGLLTFPQTTDNGYIRGTYPDFSVQGGDRFRTILGCEEGAVACMVLFRLDYQSGSGPVRAFWAMGEQSDGQYSQADIDLSPLAGLKVKFILTIFSLGPASGDRVLWVAPRIERTIVNPQ